MLNSDSATWSPAVSELRPAHKISYDTVAVGVAPFMIHQFFLLANRWSNLQCVFFIRIISNSYFQSKHVTRNQQFSLPLFKTILNAPCSLVSVLCGAPCREVERCNINIKPNLESPARQLCLFIVPSAVTVSDQVGSPWKIFWAVPPAANRQQWRSSLITAARVKQPSASISEPRRRLVRVPTCHNRCLQQQQEATPATRAALDFSNRFGACNQILHMLMLWQKWRMLWLPFVGTCFSLNVIWLVFLYYFRKSVHFVALTHRFEFLSSLLACLMNG